MNLLGMNYDIEKNTYSYSMRESAPLNCKILDFKAFSEVDLENKFILFIGCGWYGLDMATANALGEFATQYLKTNFYFKLIGDEVELPNVVPAVVTFKHLPIVMYIDNFDIKVLSTGQTHKTELWKKIDEVLGNG